MMRSIAAIVGFLLRGICVPTNMPSLRLLMAAKKRSIKIKRRIIPAEELKDYAFELGMTTREFLAYQNKKYMGKAERRRRQGHGAVSHPVYLNKEYDNFDWKKWRRGE